MATLNEEEIEEQARAVAVALAPLAGIVAMLERACPWLVEVCERSAGAHRETVGSLIVGSDRGPEALRSAIEEWHAFTQSMEPWS